MKIFVTGATGYLGRGVVRTLAAAGHHVVGLARSQNRTTALAGVPVDWVWGNLREPATYQAAAAGCEAVIHLAAEVGHEWEAVDALALTTLVSAMRQSGAPRRFVYTSGVWVLGTTPDTPIDERAPTDHAAAAVAWRVRHERQALEAGEGPIASVVVRPGIVFGGQGGIVEEFFQQTLDSGRPTIVGDGSNRWPPVDRGDLADLYLRMVEGIPGRLRSRLPADRVFHAVSGVAERVGEIAHAAALAAGGSGKTELWPVTQARAQLGPYADCLALDQVVALGRAASVFDWEPQRRGFVHHAREVFAERQTRP